MRDSPDFEPATPRAVPPAAAASKLEGRHVLFMFIVFFGSIFAVNGYMLFWALSTHTGVVAIEPYRKGLAYNARIADGERQAAIGWSDSANLDRSGLVTIRMAASDGTPLLGLHIAAVLGRAVTASGDMPLKLSEVAPGDYRAIVGPIDAGTWMITLEASQDNDRTNLYRAKRRLWLK